MTLVSSRIVNVPDLRQLKATRDTELRGYRITLDESLRGESASESPSRADDERLLTIRNNKTGDVLGLARISNGAASAGPAEIKVELGGAEHNSTYDDYEAHFLVLREAFDALNSSRALLDLGSITETIEVAEWPHIASALRENMAAELRRSLTGTIEVSQLLVYPLKSLDGIPITESTMGLKGGLKWDRCWRLIENSSGAPLTAKNCPELIKIGADYVIYAESVEATLRHRRASTTPVIRATLPGEEAKVAKWLSSFLGRDVSLQYDERGFPDDEVATGPTIIAMETVELLARSLSAAANTTIPPEEVISRLRANIILKGKASSPGHPPLWEDLLYGQENSSVTFSIGDITFNGTNPCRRCGVPARDSKSGEPLSGFQQLVCQLRKATLPPWVDPSRFRNVYRLAVNTTVPANQSAGVLRVGDSLECW